MSQKGEEDDERDLLVDVVSILKDDNEANKCEAPISATKLDDDNNESVEELGDKKEEAALAKIISDDKDKRTKQSVPAPSKTEPKASSSAASSYKKPTLNNETKKLGSKKPSSTKPLALNATSTAVKMSNLPLKDSLSKAITRPTQSALAKIHHSPETKKDDKKHIPTKAKTNNKPAPLLPVPGSSLPIPVTKVSANAKVSRKSETPKKKQALSNRTSRIPESKSKTTSATAKTKKNKNGEDIGDPLASSSFMDSTENINHKKDEKIHSSPSSKRSSLRRPSDEKQKTLKASKPLASSTPKHKLLSSNNGGKPVLKTTKQQPFHFATTTKKKSSSETSSLESNTLIKSTSLKTKTNAKQKKKSYVSIEEFISLKREYDEFKANVKVKLEELLKRLDYFDEVANTQKDMENLKSSHNDLIKNMKDMNIKLDDLTNQIALK